MQHEQSQLLKKKPNLNILLRKRQLPKVSLAFIRFGVIYNSTLESHCYNFRT